MAFIALIIFVFLLLRELSQREGSQYDNTEELTFNDCLISLVAYMLNSDYRLAQREIDYIRRQFIKIFGIDGAGAALKKLSSFCRNNISYRRVTETVRKNNSREKRFTLLRLLYGVAVADEVITYEEWALLERITVDIGLSIEDLRSINALYQRQKAQREGGTGYNNQQSYGSYRDNNQYYNSNQSDNYYSILGVPSSASNDEIKKAYRSLAKKLHPDTVANMSEEIQKETADKFRKVQEAYEKISALRGIK